MKKIEQFFSPQEAIICRAEKSGQYLFLFFLFVVSLLGLPSMCRLINAIVTNQMPSKISQELLISAFCFLLGWSIPFMALLLYISSEIVVTNKKVYIKNGIAGKLVMIPLENIAGIEKQEFNYRMTSYYIVVHLLDDKKMQSALIFSKAGIDKIVEVLADKGIKRFDYLKMKYGQYKKPLTGEALCQQFFSPILPVTVIALFVIPAAMFFIYFAAFT